MKPKVLTFYLPQFHKIPENDNWWGKGFTDWVSARTATSLFLGHYQPRIPDHDNYYNLLQKKTMMWQAKLAKKTGIYGFCIYHYWFGNGKQLLEKPAENLLRWQDIDINYCFSWANESWVCSWSRFKGNAWVYTDADGKERDKVCSGRLVKQEYGDEVEWRKHFEYLLPFFRDKRYIKKDNKPVFVIYRPDNIRRIKAMVQYWNALAIGQGFSGIYFIGTNDPNWEKRKMNAGLIYEPGYVLHEKNKSVEYAKKINGILKRMNIHIPYIYSYDNIWRSILKRPKIRGMYYGGLVDYDNTPRRGTMGYVIWGASPSKFGKYFGRLYQRAAEREDEYVFLNAWNEWGESTYLEPDSRYGMRYLWELSKIIKK